MLLVRRVKATMITTIEKVLPDIGANWGRWEWSARAMVIVKVCCSWKWWLEKPSSDDQHICHSIYCVPYSINTFHAIVDDQLDFQSLPFHTCLLCSLGLSLLLCGLSYDGADLSFMIASQEWNIFMLRMNQNVAVETTAGNAQAVSLLWWHKLWHHQPYAQGSWGVLTRTKEDPFWGQCFILDARRWSSITEDAQITWSTNRLKNSMPREI